MKKYVICENTKKFHYYYSLLRASIQPFTYLWLLFNILFLRKYFIIVKISIKEKTRFTFCRV